MKHCRLDLEYDGAPFSGWGLQPGLRTVESELRDALAALDLSVQRLTCAGRTDRGVHALTQVVSISYEGPVPEERLAPALNGELDAAIAVTRSQQVDESFDARVDALSRAYEYRVLPRRVHSPLRAARVLFHPRALDEDLLDQAAAMVMGQHDFTAFTPAETGHAYFHRTVLESRWERRADELVYCVRANAFLRHMVRVLVGTMLAVGRGAMELDQFRMLLYGAPRSEAFQTAAPHALCLVDVDYG